MKNIVTNILAVSLALGMSLSAGAQERGTQALTIEASQVISTFSFSSSLSGQDLQSFGANDYNTRITSAYSLGYRRTLDSGILLRGSLGMRNAGASTIIDEINYQWELNYFEMKIGGGYMHNLGDKFGIYLTLSPYYAYLLKANQRLDKEDFDIKESGDLKTSDIGLQVTPGVVFNMSEFISAYGEFSYSRGLSNLETGTTGQKSYNVACLFTLGLAFTIQ